jgi:hypothetical protein
VYPATRDIVDSAWVGYTRESLTNDMDCLQCRPIYVEFVARDHDLCCVPAHDREHVGSTEGVLTGVDTMWDQALASTESSRHQLSLKLINIEN